MVSWLEGPGPVIALVAALHGAALGVWAWFSRKKEIEEKTDQKLAELSRQCWELRPDLESDDVRTVREAAARTGLLAGRVMEDRLLAKNTLALVMLDQVRDQKKQAVERLKEDPVWKLLDAVEGKPRNWYN